MTTRALTTAALLALFAPACGGGVPIEVRIDEFSFDFGLDQALGTMSTALAASGLLPGGGALPEIWPEALPPIKYTLPLKTDPVPVDLTPAEDSPDYDKYQEINKAGQIVRRIEINRLVLRVEQSTLSVAIPALTLQVADDPTADPADRQAWYSVGKLPGAEPGAIEDIEFEWIPGGETFFNTQLADEFKELAVRAAGEIGIDTAANPNLPRGAAKLRLIVVATFFVEPTKAKGAL